MPKEFNHIYEKLVSDKNDIVGHIAYSIYKQDKIDYIKSKKKGETAVKNKTLKAFHEISSSESSIESYKIKAELVLQAFFENTLEEMSTDIEKQAVENQTQILQEVLIPYKPDFWKRVQSGLVSAFLFALFLALIAFILQFQDTVFEFNVKKTNDIESNTGKTDLPTETNTEIDKPTE
ncbi:hypothetical protein [uncultured Winogradskyella sp.]|uniref:hypothetical protein n=1 Tax=uncultured Winogradskyella sp. TaxID=395353 RepID=UPI002636B368|nr:hypothetical protein [uncultured Winogradskyella sp.]